MKGGGGRGEGRGGREGWDDCYGQFHENGPQNTKNLTFVINMCLASLES